MKPSETRKKCPYVERDISWMYFNQRILLEAARPEVPLLERLTFLGIYSNNLDEFFRVRVATLNRIIEYDDKNIKKEQINALPNGLICLKGGELAHEILPFRNQAISMDLKDHFKEEFFETKKVVYVPL